MDVAGDDQINTSSISLFHSKSQNYTYMDKFLRLLLKKNPLIVECVPKHLSKYIKYGKHSCQTPHC